MNDLSDEQREVADATERSSQTDEADEAHPGKQATAPDDAEQTCANELNAESIQEGHEAASRPTDECAPEEEKESLELLIKAGIDQIRRDFEDKLAYDASKQLQVDRLHSELQEARQDQIKRATHPYIHGVIQLYDILDKQIRALQKKPEKLTPERYFGLLEDLQEDVVILLEKYGVMAFQEAGDSFNPRRQTAHVTAASDSEDMIGKIVENIRPGFEQGEEILVKERVSVYVSESGRSESRKRVSDKSESGPSENSEGEN